MIRGRRGGRWRFCGRFEFGWGSEGRLGLGLGVDEILRKRMQMKKRLECCCCCSNKNQLAGHFLAALQMISPTALSLGLSSG